MAVVLNGPYGRHVLKSGYTILGRDPDCDIQLNDPRLSRHHARFCWHDGSLVIEDLNSQNGILLNGEVVVGTSNVFNGNLIAIGPAVYDIIIDENMETVRNENLNQGQQTKEQTPSEEHISKVKTENMEQDTDGLPLPQTGAHVRNQDPSSKIALTQRNSKQDQDLAAADTLADASYQNGPKTSERFKPSTSASSGNRTAAALQSNNPTTVATEAPVGEPTVSQIDALLPGSESLKKTAINSDSRMFGLIRISAVLLDAISNLLLCALISLPIFALGYTIALVSCQASIYNGMPSLDYQSNSADWQAILSSLSSMDGWQRAYQLCFEIYDVFPDAFIWIFSALTLGLLGCTLALLISLVAATTIKGGPFWHRKLGILILEKENGFFPTPLRCCARWALALLLFPVSLLTAAINIRGVHDVLSGCSVRTINDHH